MTVELKNSQQYHFKFDLSPSGYWSASHTVKDQFGMTRRFNDADISESFQRFEDFAAALQAAGWLEYFVFLHLDVDAGNEWAEGDEWVNLIRSGRIEAAQEISRSAWTSPGQLFAPPLSSEKYTLFKFNKQTGKIMLPKDSTMSPFFGHLFHPLNDPTVPYVELIDTFERVSSKFLGLDENSNKSDIFEFLDLTMLVAVDHSFANYSNHYFGFGREIEHHELAAVLYADGFKPDFLHALYIVDAPIANKAEAFAYLELWKTTPLSWFIKYMAGEVKR